MKKAFFILELLIVIVILALIYSIFVPKRSLDKLNEVTNRVLIYLNFLRYQALTDDKYNEINDKSYWHKKRWTMKFFRCRKSEGGGIYFVIYSEKNETGHPGQKESLKDPLTNRYIYSNNYCKENSKNSEFVLLKNYGIKDVNISCNSTSSLGQISFGEDGRVYSRLSSLKQKPYEYEIKKPCSIKFISDLNDFTEIIVHPNSGFVELLK